MSEPVTPLEFASPIVRESVAEMVVRRILDMVKAGVVPVKLVVQSLP